MMNLALILDRRTRDRRIADAEPVTIANMPAALDVFKREAFTGCVCLHFHEGHPTVLEVADPQRIKILRG